MEKAMPVEQCPQVVREVMALRLEDMADRLRLGLPVDELSVTTVDADGTMEIEGSPGVFAVARDMPQLPALSRLRPRQAARLQAGLCLAAGAICAVDPGPVSAALGWVVAAVLLWRRP